jgi:selenide, water dikinase
MRFIDLARHGGCSHKAPASELKGLLGSLREKFGSDLFQSLASDFPDTGTFFVGELELQSTIDIVLPMVHSPSHFGEIALIHSISDLHAAFAKPMFVLCSLGVPKSLKVDHPTIQDMLGAAARQVQSEGAVLIGGHTMAEQEDLYLGFACIGQSLTRKTVPARKGDCILLTKKLGTSIATLRWKSEEANENQHADVLVGMRTSNKFASEIFSRHSISACTDVTGYGLLGHLHNILNKCGVAAQLNAEKLPIYDSVRSVDFPEQSRLYWSNREYASTFARVPDKMSGSLERSLFDSQVSGGLLAIVKKNDCSKILSELSQKNVPATCIGHIGEGESGSITVDMALSYSKKQSA